MTLIELQVTKQALRRQLDEYERITPSCMTCQHMDAGLCAKFNAQPPAEWKAGPVDCAEWIHDGIPF
jgi:hypothetical protein